MSYDAREIALKSGLRQLHDDELLRLLIHLHYGRDVTLDHVNYEETSRTFCPLAIAIGLPKMMRQRPTNQSVTIILELLGLRVYNTRGVEGTFFTTSRRDDLQEAVQDVLWERQESL